MSSMTTSIEADHHEQALTEAGYAVRRIRWGPDFIARLIEAPIDLVFNVSSLAEAAILEDLGLPYVGSDTFAIAISTDKSLAKRLWREVGLPTSPFVVARTKEDCLVFGENPPFPYPLFIKPVAGRGSAGVNETSVIHDFDQLIGGVTDRYRRIGQPVLIERYLRGREITLGVLGNRNARVLPPLEIVYRTGDPTLSFEKKEMDNDTFLCPARLTATEAEDLRELALKAYRVLGFRDYGRFDTILTDEGPMLLEGNAFAGLMCMPPEKPRSYIGFMARAERKDGAALLDEIIQTALERQAQGA